MLNLPVTEHSANDQGVRVTKPIVTDSTPDSVIDDLYPTSKIGSGLCTINKSDTGLTT